MSRALPLEHFLPIFASCSWDTYKNRLDRARIATMIVLSNSILATYTDRAGLLKRQIWPETGYGLRRPCSRVEPSRSVASVAAKIQGPLSDSDSSPCFSTKPYRSRASRRLECKHWTKQVNSLDGGERHMLSHTSIDIISPD